MKHAMMSREIMFFLPKDRKKEFCHYDNGLCHNVKENKVFPLER